MPQADYSLLRPTQSINTPFENLGAILALRNQQEGNRALVEQRQAAAEKARQETETKRREEAAAAQVRSLFARPNQPPTPEELSAVVGPEAATKIFQGFEALRTARGANQDAERARIASVLGAITAFPSDELRAKAYAGARAQLIADGTLTPEDAPEAYSPAFVQNALRAAMKPTEIANLDKPIEVSPGASLMSPSGQVIGTAPKPPGSDGKPASVQEYEYALTQGFKGTFEDYQNADANRKQRAASERAPYFTYQPVFDDKGRPISAIRFDARGGPPQVVDVSALTGGGQLKPPPGTTAQQAITDEVSTAQLDRLKDMFNQGAAAFIGPAAGRARSIGQKVPGVPVNKTFADFEAASAAFRNSVIKAITGAAMSEPEAQRIRQQIPDVTDKPAVWLSKYEQTRKNLGDLEKALKNKSTAAPAAPPGDRVRVKGPNGETGTVPKGTTLPPGWSLIGG